MKGIKHLTPTLWEDYELIDSGDFEKLERFGKWIVARPEPQAVWGKTLSETQWQTQAHAWFKRSQNSEERGKWELKRGMPEQWFIGYNYKKMAIKMRLGLTSFKHVGIFPEQAENWNFIYDNVVRIGEKTTPKVLNLFAYTGGASLAAKSAGADLTHVDSVRQVITWSRENMEASGLEGIRWMIEDALKFVKREVKRGKKYNGIILDPPAYGRGPDGERWILEESVNELISECSKLLEDKDSFLVFNLYSMGLSALLARTVVSQHFGESENEEFGELYFSDNQKKILPLGVFYRFYR
ncbi:MAG: class I SAM-dependent methyltransferase [Rikenellaceae bacterium]